MLKSIVELQRLKLTFHFKVCLLILSAVLSRPVPAFQGSFTHTFNWRFLLLLPDLDARFYMRTSYKYSR